MVFSVHNGTKLKITNKKIVGGKKKEIGGKFPNTWKSNNTLLSNI